MLHWAGFTSNSVPVGMTCLPVSGLWCVILYDTTASFPFAAYIPWAGAGALHGAEVTGLVELVAVIVTVRFLVSVGFHATPILPLPGCPSSGAGV